MKAPLDGYRVLDWTIFIAGSVASSILGDLGAEVIKIEQPGAGDPQRGAPSYPSLRLPNNKNIYFELANRNKKSLTVDITKPEGREIIYRLVEKSDVFVQNFRKGVAARRGLDYDTLRKNNPKLIYASASAFGPKGPDRDRPALDLSGAARSGLMTIDVEPSLPVTHLRDGICDRMGGIMTAQAVIIALLMRERQGAGREVEVSMLGSMTQLLSQQIGIPLVVGREEPRNPRDSANSPLFNIYRCQDDKWLILVHVQPDRHWPSLCRAMGMEHLEKDPKFDNFIVRAENGAELVRIMDAIFATKTRDEWFDVFEQHGDLIYEPINTITEVTKDPQVWANDYIRELDHPIFGKIGMVGFPLHISDASYSEISPAPELGQHTEEVLRKVLGYNREKINYLKGEGVI